MTVPLLVVSLCTQITNIIMDFYILEEPHSFSSKNKATSFVIVSEKARKEIFSCLEKINWFLDKSNCELIDIACHSYDHFT
jgi:hypothetical protein